MAHATQSDTAWREVRQVVWRNQLSDASLTLVSLTNRVDDRSDHTGSRPVTWLMGSIAGKSSMEIMPKELNLLRITPG